MRDIERQQAEVCRRVREGYPCHVCPECRHTLTQAIEREHFDRVLTEEDLTYAALMRGDE